jgi:hypothetical protein
MLRRRTLFIIGAGTGVGIDMPVGDELSATIAQYTHIARTEEGWTGDPTLGSIGSFIEGRLF